MSEQQVSAGRLRLGLMVGALGVVYGDIGTSPLYALRECFTPPHGMAPTPENIFGILSLIVWSLVLIVSVKYLNLVMRADNKGEGGILALLAVAVNPVAGKKGNHLLLILGLFGAALLYGDGVLTPAVTVLGAMEGLEIATPAFKPYVVPMAVVVLLALFSVQRVGTGKVGLAFGPVMLVWFFTLAALGVKGIWTAPEILKSLSPHYAAIFFWNNGYTAIKVLGSVFLVVTGAEALYADMGHFGAGPIRRAWFTIVFPGLLLNYFGEGALLLREPAAAQNPFYLLAPGWAVVPLVVLATMAAVIASQALITGAYSLTMQAIQMGYLPRLIIRHTSHVERGQIFMPHVNIFLMVACIWLVLEFGSSSRLAGAYGIAVSLTMLVTTVLFYAAARRVWGWNRWRAGLVCGAFLVMELAFAFANGLKLWQGGWVPLVVGIAVFGLLTTWKQGRQRLRDKLAQAYVPFDTFLEELGDFHPHRVPGTAVFLAGNPNGTPVALLHNLKHNKVLHERVVLLTIITREMPFVGAADRLKVERLREDIYRVVGAYGFMEQPNVPALLAGCATRGLEIHEMKTTYFLSRETIVASRAGGWRRWRRFIFSTMSRNAQPATAFFQLPPNRVVELGMQVEI